MVVFANGCFDPLTIGHVEMLRWARQQGDRLIVGVNSDQSVRSLKGNRKPYCPAEWRVGMLEAIRWVDEVQTFDEPTPARLVESLRPNIVVVGWDGEVPAEVLRVAASTEGWAPCFVRAPRFRDVSSSQMIQHILEAHGWCE